MNLLQEFAMRDIIKFGSFILKSGQTSNYYINLKALVSYPDLLNDIVDKMITNIDSNSFNDSYKALRRMFPNITKKKK